MAGIQPQLQPVSYVEILLGYVGAAATKSALLGLIILATASFLVPVHIEHPLWMLVFLAIVGEVRSQDPIQLTRSASDCVGAIRITDNQIGPVFSPRGFGNELEIQGYELGDPYFIQREHNTVWYRFTAPYHSVFSFDLVPIHKDDDFDFMLFKYDGPNFCRNVAAGKKIPVRTNISRKNDTKIIL